MALYDGVPSVRLEGDQKKALALLPLGKSLLAKAQSVARNADVNTFSMSERVDSDSYIYVLIAGGQNVISISCAVDIPDTVYVDDPDVPATTAFPDFLSGVVANGLIESVTTTGPDGAPRVTRALRKWFPTNNCAKVQGIKAEWQGSTRLAVTPDEMMTDWISEGATTVNSQLYVPRSSMWTGTMAKVVQLLFGMGRIGKRKMRGELGTPAYREYVKGVENDGVRVRYDYKFMRTHGVVRGSDKSLWLVEVSAARGVVAMPLPFIPGSDLASFRDRAQSRGDDHMVDVLEDLGCLPSGESFPVGLLTFNKAVAAGDILVLKTPEEMSDFYGRLSGFSSICGWAFSENGTEAHNVGYYYPEGENYQKSIWYQLNLKLELNTKRKANDPIGFGSADLRKQLEGTLYTRKVPKIGAVIPVKYHEDLLSPPGLLSHDAGARADIPPKKPVEGPVYVGFVDGSLKVARYYNPGQRVSASSSFDDRIGEDCFLGGSWSWSFESGGNIVPAMPYTNEFDDRSPLPASVTSGTMTVAPSGYGAAQATVFIDRPQYVRVWRVRIFATHTTTDSQNGESRSACFIVPRYLRNGYYYYAGRAFGGHSGTEGTSYGRATTDPNEGVSWSRISGGLGGSPPYGEQCSYKNCGGNHEDPKIMCTVYEEYPCSEYADSGTWLSQCGQSFAFSGSGIRGPSWSRGWNKGNDFAGTWNLVAGPNGPTSGETTYEEHLYAMKPSPDPETGEVQHIHAVRSCLGEPTIIYERGFWGGGRIEGYVPTTDSIGWATFIGVIK